MNNVPGALGILDGAVGYYFPIYFGADYYLF